MEQKGYPLQHGCNHMQILTLILFPQETKGVLLLTSEATRAGGSQPQEGRPSPCTLPSRAGNSSYSYFLEVQNCLLLRALRLKLISGENLTTAITKHSF